MIIVTTIATGLFTGLLRSVFAVIAVAFAIFVLFAAAALTGPVSLLDLGLAILGYNLGIALLIGGQLAVESRRPVA